jgi:dihydrofolate reductase
MKFKIFIAMSLDGYIAGKDDDLSFLPTKDPNDPNNDFGYRSFYESCDCIIMGKKTYDVTKDFPKQFFETLPTYIISSLDGDKCINYENILNLPYQNIYVLGGGVLISSLLKDGLIDDIELFIVSTVLGEGIPLFKDIHVDFDMILSKQVLNHMTHLSLRRKK